MQVEMQGSQPDGGDCHGGLLAAASAEEEEEMVKPEALVHGIDR